MEQSVNTPTGQPNSPDPLQNPTADRRNEGGRFSPRRKVPARDIVELRHRFMRADEGVTLQSLAASMDISYAIAKWHCRNHGWHQLRKEFRYKLESEILPQLKAAGMETTDHIQSQQIILKYYQLADKMLDEVNNGFSIPAKNAGEYRAKMSGISIAMGELRELLGIPKVRHVEVKEMKQIKEDAIAPPPPANQPLIEVSLMNVPSDAEAEAEGEGEEAQPSDQAQHG